MSNNEEKAPVPKGYWEAADGSLTPESKISDLDKARDAVVKRLMAAAQSLSGELAQFKKLALQEVENFTQLSKATYGVEMRGARGKGNITLTSYDGRFKVERQVSDRITFDERLQVAKDLLTACIRKWGKGADKNLMVLVNDAFRVDKSGNVSVSRVLSLRRHQIDDPQWKSAMEAVADSMQATASATYVRFYVRDEESGAYRAVSLDAAKA